MCDTTMQSQEFYCTLANDLYGDTMQQPENNDYSKSGPAESPEVGIYEQPVEVMGESGVNSYETPQVLSTEK